MYSRQRDEPVPEEIKFADTSSYFLHLAYDRVY